MKLPIKKSSIINILGIILHNIKSDNKMVLFSSFNGQYNDNLKYVAEELNKLDKSLKLVWVISDKTNEKILPQYLKIVRFNSLKYAFYINRAFVVIDNILGIYSGTLDSNQTIKGKIRRFFQKKFKKQKQLNISTWHGTPLKRIGADIPNSDINNQNFYSTLNMLFAGSEYEKRVFERAFLNKIPVKVTGYPRNDILFNISNNTIYTLRKKLNLPIDKKIILYAPTYREDINNSGVRQMEELNLNELFNSLSMKFGGDWVFVFRVHHNVLKSINIEGITMHYGDKVINGNLFDDMAEYLCACDILLTDYSGSMFDYALTYKPCFLYCPDIKNYEQIERGFYIDIRALPFPLAETFEELLQNISLFSKENHYKETIKFLRLIGSANDGYASSRIAKIILDYMNNETTYV